ncbi:MAG: 2-dehydro-3-deoxy-D-gluconate 5-dehydrogenase KduD [Sedimentibacter sp.]|uniref:2-dehydro-3-deoxy-D-gluconate 5-dehydrogenase KduD n=1 Tax=Sedimentibacter sp. TaxID=1960295 RepID=UPI002982B36B|nr:2-dehydro-3-deoxy-D-gluconate 5-dehydrogenase KduD [Sedimentibacter sp.]MDW5300287.1 2-dehydro-3-deoxy-D-gluconate 5-dehydrogenase KduD [Sedimentibacter sp.]
MFRELDKFNMDMFSLKNKVAVITGGNKGLGLAYAVALAKAGADIFLPCRSKTNWEEIESLIKKENRRVEFMQVDLSDKDMAKASIDKCIEVYGRIDILVNNAGTIRRSPITEFKDEDWKEVIDINLNSIYYLSQTAVKYMIKQGGGKIINIASMLSFQGGKFVPSYTASKHGIAGLTKAFANELADKNIQINAIAPGYIKTDNTAPIRQDEKRNVEILSRIPAGRWGETADLMGTIVYLASPASDYVNGHILAVDGGWLVR